MEGKKWENGGRKMSEMNLGVSKEKEKWNKLNCEEMRGKGSNGPVNKWKMR